MNIENITFALIFLFITALALFTVLYKVIFAFYKSRGSNYPMSFSQLLGMHLRKQDLNKLIEVNNYIKKHSLQLTLSQVEEFYLRGGNLDELLKKAKEEKDNYRDFDFRNYVKEYNSNA